jgi:hypothetical protein
MGQDKEAMIIQGMPVVQVDGKLRVSHIEVAKRLGYERSDSLVKLIEEHRTKLESFDLIALEAEKSKRRGRPKVTYLLSQEQVLYLCAKSEQELATAITIQMVIVFSEALKSRAPSRTEQIFHRLLAPEPSEWDEMFSDQLVRALIVLDRKTWVGGPHPRYLRSTYAKIYDMVVGSDVWAEMGRRADDPAFLHARKHQQLQPGPRKAFRLELEFVRVLADQSRTKDEFWARCERRYGDRTLQLGFGAGFDAEELL